MKRFALFSLIRLYRFHRLCMFSRRLALSKALAAVMRDHQFNRSIR